MDEDSKKIKRIIISLYAASFFLQFGVGMSAVFIPLFARDLGASILMVGIIVTAKSIGSMLFSLPGGFIISKYKTQFVIAVSLSGIILAAVLRGLSLNPFMLVAAGLLMGVFSAIWNLNRLTYVRQNIPQEIRGRTLASFGGIMRLSRIIGPLLGGLVISKFGYTKLFYLQACITGIAAVILLVFLPAEKQKIAVSVSDSLQNVKHHYTRNKQNITAAMIGIIGLTIVRVSRGVIVPLWADSIGISVTNLGLITSISAGVELLLVLPAGLIMDKAGRKWALVPALVIMAVSMSFIPLTGSFQALLLVSISISIGNGLGSGINMVIGTDLAPDNAPGQFLGFWRFFTDSGMAVGPVIVGVVADSFSLGSAPVFISGVGLAAAVYLILFFKKHEETR
ncbi:MAG: MFS transporter [Bacteroidetes bacterium]|nr:MFS transporter [Bacteroidota bacterium]